MKHVEIVLFSIFLVLLSFKIWEINSITNRIGYYQLVESTAVLAKILDPPSYRSSKIKSLLTCLRTRQCNSAGKSYACEESSRMEFALGLCSCFLKAQNKTFSSKLFFCGPF